MSIDAPLSEWPDAVVNCDLLREVPDDVKAAFFAKAERFTVDTQQAILEQGKTIEKVVLIASGEVEVSAVSQSGHEMVLYCAGEGEILGDIEALADLPSIASCTAMPGSSFVRVTTDHFTSFLTNPIFSRNLARLTYYRMSFVNEMHAQNRYLPVDALICSHLITLSRHDRVIRRPQSYIAQLASCSRQTVNRCLGALRDDGIVELRKGVIEVIDPERLARRWR